MKWGVCRRISTPAPSLLHVILQHRSFSFINTRLKWVRDPLLDSVVEREKNLIPCLSLKSIILSSPSLSLPLSHPSLLHFPNTTPTHLFHKYPSLFRIFRPHSPPSISTPHHVKLTPQFLSLHQEEQQIHDSMPHKHLAAHRLLKFLMLTRASTLPLPIIDAFKFDLGLPPNYLLHLVSYFPQYFRVCQLNCPPHQDGSTPVNSQTSCLGLELVSWDKEFALPAILNHFQPGEGGGGIVEFPLSFSPGFDLQKKVKHWVDEWQSLPYISPYENAFHLPPTSDQADKWAVAVLHELLSLLVSKKTEVKNVLRLGDYLGLGLRFKKALAHHPGIFYVSNKIRTQTVLLRQAFRKDRLLDNHPLMGMRHRYIYLMSKSRKRNKLTKLSTKHNLRIHGDVS